MGIPAKMIMNIHNILKKETLLLIISLFSLTGYAQFSLAPNGVTIVCPGASSGDPGAVGGVTYTAVDRTHLISKRDAGEDLSLCCTTPVTSLNRLFQNKYTFNGDISNWDTSNVTNMDYTFIMAYKFNQDISNWDTSNVTSMNNMFSHAREFNADISGWDTSNVTDMGGMFYDSRLFNAPIVILNVFRAVRNDCPCEVDGRFVRFI